LAQADYEPYRTGSQHFEFLEKQDGGRHLFLKYKNGHLFMRSGMSDR